MTAWDAEISAAAVVAFPRVLAVVGPFLAGLVVAGLLLGAFWLGRRWMLREPPVPGPDEHGHIPAGGPVHEERERRTFDEMPRYAEPDRRTPHELPGFGQAPTRRSPVQRRRRWRPGRSGAFGSGGSGATR